MSTDFEFHPLANLFPLTEGDDFNELVEDICANGLRQPIARFEGKILDGRNRYLACLKAGVELIFEDYNGTDPLSYVVSLNMKRRHLTDGQRAMIADKIATLPKGTNQHASIEAPSQAQAAEMLHTSRTSVQRAKTVREHGDPELTKKVETGKIKLNKAVEQIKQAKKETPATKPAQKKPGMYEQKTIDDLAESNRKFAEARDERDHLREENVRLQEKLNIFFEGCGATPVERAQAAVQEMSADEKKEFVRWLLPAPKAKKRISKAPVVPLRNSLNYQLRS